MTDLETQTELETQIPSKKKKRVRGNAIDKLARATARRVRDDSTRLSDALFERALKGDVNCTKLLVALIERVPPPTRKHRSIALEWANSPEWTGPNPVANWDDEEVEAEAELNATTFVSAMLRRDSQPE